MSDPYSTRDFAPSSSSRQSRTTQSSQDNSRRAYHDSNAYESPYTRQFYETNHTSRHERERARLEEQVRAQQQQQQSERWAEYLREQQYQLFQPERHPSQRPARTTERRPIHRVESRPMTLLTSSLNASDPVGRYYAAQQTAQQQRDQQFARQYACQHRSQAHASSSGYQVQEVQPSSRQAADTGVERVRRGDDGRQTSQRHYYYY